MYSTCIYVVNVLLLNKTDSIASYAFTNTLDGAPGTG